jgi:hypothetical protein
MSPIPISVINKSTILTNEDIAPVIAAIQIQVSQHLAPKWRVDATLEIVAQGQDPPEGNWQLIFSDDTNQGRDAGYHGADAGFPVGKVFVRTAQQNEQNWTITASHEVLEMLVNPYAVFAAYVPFDGNTGAFYQLEICDPVSPDEFSYKINGINVSDFVFPEWFSPFLAQPDPQKPSKQVDYCSRLDGPVPKIVKGTTIAAFGWKDVRS